MTGPQMSAPLDQNLDDSGGPLPEAGTRTFWVGLVVVVLAVISGLATYLIVTGLTPIAPRNDIVLSVMFVNIVLIIAMIGVIGWQLYGLWQGWRRKVAGARLHGRIVALFSAIAAIPAILLAIAATNTFSHALDSWFSVRTRLIIENSLDVANAYLEEHGQVIRTDIVNMAKDLDDSGTLATDDPRQFRDLVMAQAGLRELSAAYVIDPTGKVVLSGVEDEKIPFVSPPAEALKEAEAGQVPLFMPTRSYRVAALVKLHDAAGRYLYVARGVNPKVIGHLRRTQAGVAEYEELRRVQGGLKAAHGLMYSMISLTAVCAAIWIGLWFAGRFVAPIRRLIAAAQQISKGDLDVALPVRRGEGDLRRLSQTFNTMSSELKTKRDALVSANEQLLERRHFMEAVLGNVSAGVLGLDAAGRITIANRSAEQMLGAHEGGLFDKPLSEVVPEFAALLDEARNQQIKSRAHDQIKLDLTGEERIFAVRVTRDRAEGHAAGAVVTFDDITDLVSAQRTTAWADVARRIAHEIKNPLTPIQLSAERIRRKYGHVIKEDREVFDKCTETIIRQVGDVTRMVDEFSAFARMPKPQIEMQDLRAAVRDAVTLFQMGDSNVTFKLDLPAEPVLMLLDRRLISQAMTNLIKNGAESTQQVAEKGDAPPDYKGRVETRVSVGGGLVTIEVIDNGIGLAKHNRSRLLEPYVTTKAKGTGLGLAIVQKIVEQHGGALTLEDAPAAAGGHGGALVRISLPMRSDVELSEPARTAAE